MQRHFSDELGGRWQVWEIRPSNQGANVSATYRQGWLAFESTADEDARHQTRETTRLRLAPVPEAWEAAPEVTLRGYLKRAVPAPPRFMDADGRLPRVGPS